jgi:ATP-dependent DNA helicase RecG
LIREAVLRELKRGGQVYYVHNEVETIENSAARLIKLLPEARIRIAHGQMPERELELVMRDFYQQRFNLLLCTTIIETGIDIPTSNTIIIDRADKFGLAQLHQLRGRVGRGSERSTCLLLYRSPLGETAKRRLATLRETDDGFRIAEEDLALRGEGEVLGTRQSGLPGFKIARPEWHRDLLEAARKDAALFVARDPMLSSDRGRALRLLLHLFEREDAVRLIEAG